MWILILVGAVIVAGIWASVFFLPVPIWVAIVVTSVVVLAIVGVAVFRRIRAVRRAAALERALLQQAAEQANAARPDRREEILALQAQMKAAIAALKRTKLAGSGGQSALYALPWYVIAGPPAAGKTTALEQSGLRFSAAGGGGSKVRGTAGTRNCDWWFSQEAVLLDTAGRFATEDDDRDEWLAFLDTVRRFRPEKPLDGLVVAISIADLATADASRIEELATKIRARVDEIMDRLEVVLPVYLMFTKADLIAGFIEFWGDLTKQQRAQAWGAAFAFDDAKLDEPARAFEAEFDLLVGGLHRRLLDRLPRERAPEVRARILQFPVEFRSLRAALSQFVEEFCRADAYQDAPMLRGFYFTSGTQVGRPIDRVLSNMLRGFDLQSSAIGAPAPAAQSQSYFVSDVFRSVIFPDRHAAMSTERRVRRRARRRALVVGSGLLATLVLVVPAVISYLNNLDLVDATLRAAIGAPAGSSAAAISASAAKVPLDKLLAQVKSLDAERAKLKIPALVGPRAAPPLYEPVRTLYTKRLRAIMEGPVREQLVADVGSVGGMVRTDAGTFESAYNDLKLYLMLTGPEHLDVEWAAPRLVEKWERAVRTTAGESRVAEHVRFYLDALAADASWAWPPDETRISNARARLARQPLEELQYGWLVGNARGVPSIGPDQVFYGAAARYATARGNVEVPGCYTKAGWEKIRAALDQPASDLVAVEPWVLGDARPAGGPQDKADVSRLKDLYFVRYEKAWTDFLAGIGVQPPGDVATAIEELRALGESDGPYTRLFRLVSDNVTLDVGPTSLAGKALEKGKEALAAAAGKLTGADAGAPERTVSPVERHFRPLLRFAFGDASGPKGDGAAPSSLSQYLAQLATLEVALAQLAESKTAPTTQFEAELDRTKGAVSRLFSGLDPETRLLIEPLLMNPIRGSQAGVASSSFGYLSEKWKAEVWEIWNTKLAPRYPFADAKEEVALQDFAEFFRPQTGTLWKFFVQNLQDRLERSGNSFTPKPSADPIPFRADYLRCLNIAQEISDALFGAGADLSVPFSIKLQPAGADIAEITFQIGNQAIVYRNEPERWIPTQWPAKEGGPKGALLQVKGNGFTDQIPRMGDFGMFRLLEAGNLKPLSSGDGSMFVATFNLTRPGEPPVTIQFKPLKATHPFARDFFRRLRCPADVTEGTVAAAGANGAAPAGANGAAPAPLR